MTLTQAYARAEAQGVDVDDVPLRAVPSMSFPEGWIALDTARISTRHREKELLAHELGHCETGSFYNVYSPYDLKSKNEYKANKRSYEMLVPLTDLKRALRKGIVEHWDLAEHFDVSDRYMHRALTHYRALGLI